MPVSDAISRRFVGAYDRGSLSANARTRRWEWLANEFPDIGEMRVLDVGGDARSWQIGGVRPGHVTLLNIAKPDAPESWMTGVAGDACEDLDLGTFDLAFSNSVIEHVGGHWRRLRYAELVRRSAPSYWVQTPYRYFPIEPHFLVPGLQFLPIGAQARVVSRWPVGNYSSISDRALALQAVTDVELQSKAQMQAYFPDAELKAERFGPLVKSWVAIRKHAKD